MALLTPTRRRRVWCETLPLPELRTPRVLSLLARYGLELLAAVRPGDLDEVAPLLQASADAGVRAGLWPMLDDRDGRWPSAANVDRFADLVRAMRRAAGGAPVAEVAVDLEPPIGRVARWLSAGSVASALNLAGRAPLAPARAAFARMAAELAADGVAVTAAVVPMVLLDPEGERGGAWQRWMGTPVDGVAWPHVSVMLYTSIFEGWSRGALDRGAARGLLARGCALAKARYGAAAGASLGAVSTGALGDEPVYRDPGELADDVAIAVDAGLDDLILFDLAGALRRAPAEAWLDAFTRPPEAPAPSESLRVYALLAAGAAFGRLP